MNKAATKVIGASQTTFNARVEMSWSLHYYAVIFIHMISFISPCQEHTLYFVQSMQLSSGITFLHSTSSFKLLSFGNKKVGVPSNMLIADYKH